MALTHNRRSSRFFANVLLGSLALVLVLGVSGCGDSDTNGPSPRLTAASGSLVDFSDCKLTGDGLKEYQSATEDCIFYRYDGVGALDITHINAGFNCCPGELVATVDITNRVITITEGESQSACRCLCLFDVDYEIVDLVPGTYTIRFVEVYTEEDDEVLEYTVDLTAEPSGLHCVNRDHYPWDDGSGTTEPSGRLTGASGCKSYNATGAFDVTPPNQDCVDYHYNGNNILLLTHLNAGFNCCPVIGADIVVENDVITITEIEISGLCDCLCLFDLDYEIVNVPPGVYTVKVIEPHLMPGDDALEFVADLTGEPSGTFCVERSHYPWGL